MHPVTIVEHAHPKINLTLRVPGRRPDGFHELESLVAFARDIADAVTLTPAPDTDRRVTCSGPFGDTIAGQNLIEVALDLIAAEVPSLELGHVNLEKNLPVTAGIGGGSADAAAVIRAVIRANGPQAVHVDWHAIARRLGADVPVCLLSTAQLMRGIGEIITPFEHLPPLAAVLINPMVAVPANKTAQVFRKLGATALSGEASRRTPSDFAGPQALLSHMAETGNDLYGPAREIVPEIDTVLDALRSVGHCQLAQLSGGGPTCFGIYADITTAHEAAARLGAACPRWWVRASSLS